MVLETSVCWAHLGVHACKLTIPASWDWEATLWHIQLCWLAGRWNEGSHWGGGGVGGLPCSRGSIQGYKDFICLIDFISISFLIEDWLFRSYNG